MTRKWTPEQEAAIRTRGSNLLVSAGAGAGKTAVLVERIIRYLTDGERPVNVDELLVVTFTKAAAAEMRDRIRRALAERLRENPTNLHLRRQLVLLNRASISTLHSFCSDLVRKYFYRLDLDPDFRIMDADEESLLKQDVLETLFEGRYAAEEERRRTKRRLTLRKEPLPLVLKWAGQGRPLLTVTFSRLPGPFLSLVEKYGGGSGDSQLKALVMRFFELVRTQPWPAEWLSDITAAFDLPEAGDIEDLPWTREFADELLMELERIRSWVGRALKMALLPGGPDSYEEALREDHDLVERLIAAVRLSSDGSGKDHRLALGSWEQMEAAFAGAVFSRLKSAGKDCDPLLKEKIRGLRDRYKKKITSLRNGCFSQPASQILQDISSLSRDMKTLTGLVAEFEEEYAARKRARGLLDYADLERFALKLLLAPGSSRDNPVPSDVAAELRKRYHEVLVDEYQDINPLQETLLQLVSRQPASEPGGRRDGWQPNLFMVGDVKQSIFRFRLAEPGLFRLKLERYKTGAKGEAGLPAGRVINLSTNFRSRRGIIDAVNFLFRQVLTGRTGEGLEYGREEELLYGASYPEPGDAGKTTVELHLVERADPAPGVWEEEEGETEAVAAEPRVQECGEGQDLSADEREFLVIAYLVRRLVRPVLEHEPDGPGTFKIWDEGEGRYRPASYRDIVILMRGIKGRAETALEVLDQAGIPARVETEAGSAAAVEIQTVLSLLRVIDNPRQDIPLAAVLRSPMVGLTAEELALIRLAGPGEFHRAVLAAAARPGKEPAEAELGQKLKGFFDRLENWRTAARRETLAALLWRLYRETGYFDYVGGMPGGARRQANLRALHDRALKFDEFSPSGNLFNFLRYIEKLESAGGELVGTPVLGEKEDAVRIMSIHAAKGLEFPVVIVAGLGNRFNLEDLSGDILLHRRLGLGPRVVDPLKRVKYPSIAHRAIARRAKIESLAEELRLLYVAMTRAREKLVLIGSVRGVASRCGSWCESVEHAGWQLSDADLAEAGSFLDWIGPALARHPGGKGLREAAGQGGHLGDYPGADVEVAGDPSCWEVHLWGPPAGKVLPFFDLPGLQTVGEKIRVLPVHGGLPAEAGWQELASLKPLNIGLDPGLETLLRERIEWVYPYKQLQSIPAKLSVTEARRRFDSADPEAAASMVPRLVVKRRPRFLESDPQAVTAAERGIAVHLALQHLELASPLNLDDIRAQVVGMVQRELLTPEQAQAVLESAPDMAWFFRQPPGMQMKGNSQQVRREVFFTLRLPVTAFNFGVSPEVAEGEFLVLQGTIDCLLEGPEGFTVIEFKTDRLDPDSNTLPELVERYRAQLDLYARAVEEIYGKQAFRAYLVFLSAREVLEVPINNGE